VVPPTLETLMVAGMAIISLGIDASARSSGLTYINGSSVKVKRILPKKLVGSARLNYIYTETKSFLKDLQPPEIIIMEGPSFFSTNKPFTMGEIYGTFKLCIYSMYSREISIVTPKQLKKYLAGSGDATKEQMKKAAVRLGCPSAQEDICDAYSAALLGKDLLGKTNTPSTRKSMEIIASLGSLLNQIESPD